jgi:hypothetical protein
MNKLTPCIYLAGKIDKSDWRHQVVPELRRHEAYLETIDTNEFIYVGPFFKSCDHGCFHTDGSHGLLGQNQKLRRLAQLQVRNSCFEAVRNCDIFFLYINHPEVFGSLVEVGWAQAFNKKVVVIYAPGIASPYSNDYWFSSITADRTLYDVEACNVRRIIYDVIGDLFLGNTSGCWE